jgi:hypothetical protein
VDDPTSNATYSISLRLIRTTTEYAYVGVPVEGDVVRPDAGGVGRIDPDELIRRALEIGQNPEVVWYREDRSVGPHPMQKAPDADEVRYPI